MKRKDLEAGAEYAACSSNDIWRSTWRVRRVKVLSTDLYVETGYRAVERGEPRFKKVEKAPTYGSSGILVEYVDPDRDPAKDPQKALLRQAELRMTWGAYVTEKRERDAAAAKSKAASDEAREKRRVEAVKVLEELAAAGIEANDSGGFNPYGSASVDVKRQRVSLDFATLRSLLAQVTK